MTCVRESNTHGLCPQWTFSASTNRITSSGFAYDAAGNLTTDVSGAYARNYSWDAEGRLTKVTDNGGGTSTTYSYNALGQRAELVTTGWQLEQLFDTLGERVGYYAAGSGNNYWLAAYVPFGGRELAEYSTGTTFAFMHTNALGSAIMATLASGAPGSDILFYPWGQEWQSGGGMYDTHFAGMHASLQGSSLFDYTMYDAPFRFYASNLGRWHSPDPMGGNITNPQSLNRYAYVANNPTSLTDPVGLQGGCMPGSEQAGMCRNGTFYPPGGPVNPYNPFTNPGWNWDPFDLMNIIVYSGTTYVQGDYGVYEVGVNQVGYAIDYFDLLGLDSLPSSGMGAMLTALAPEAQAAPQDVCEESILNAVNGQFGTNFTPNDVTQTFTPTGGATNLIIFGTGLPAAQFNSLQPGRYAPSPLTWLTGYGPTLHITGQTWLNGPPAVFTSSNIGGNMSVLFTAHIDYGFVFNPIGALYHLFREVLHLGGARRPC